MILSRIASFLQRGGLGDGHAYEAPPDLLPVLTPNELLASPSRRARMRELTQLAAVPNAHFDALYKTAIDAFAVFVQQLPASEVHHHAGPGGMLDHTLEVAVTALSLRRGHLLPAGAEPEVLVRQQDVWTYAVFTSALLHDIGKPVVDQRIAIFDASGHALGSWNAWGGPMQAAFYRVNFNRQRCYGMHTRAAPFLARLILPDRGMAWLAENQDVLAAWLATVSGDREAAGAMGEIIMRADGESVAKNLGAGSNIRFATEAIPLHEKLLTALRFLISDGGLPLNRNGAAGWITGDDLWLVSKRAADAVRDHLTKEGHSGIPTRNDRLFDVLQEHNVLVRNGDQAIWRGTVSGDGWAHSLTMLRLPIKRVWPDQEGRPKAFDGTVEPSETETAPISDSESNDEERIVPASFARPVKRVDAIASSISTLSAPSTPDAIPASDDGSDDEGQRFLIWLRKEVAEWRIKVNQADARVHVVPEGVLLVSPAIFKDFAKTHSAPWEHIQKRFLKLKIHQRADDSNIFQYSVERQGGNHDKKTDVVKGIVISDPSVVFGETRPPNANPVLHLKVKS